MEKISWLEQNPVDYYNLHCKEEVVRLLFGMNKTLKELKPNLFCEEVNRGETTDILEYKNGYFTVLNVNSFALLVDAQYSPFQLLTRFRFNNNFIAAFYYVGMHYQDMSFPYIRVGTKYFKRSYKVDRYGIKREELLIWNKDEIKQDYGKDLLERVQKYDDFIIEPDNQNYQQTVNGRYNLYAPFAHEMKEFDVKNDMQKIKWSMILMRHIFQEQLGLGLKYLKILYDHPKQPLPILVPVSEERSTGKSTFIDWLSIIFGANMVIINPEDISSSFNSSYAVKNIIAIEESRFESIQATEKLKALATQKTLSVNTKFLQPYDTPFYGKLIITSNDETKFSRVDAAEIRYWVRKIGSLNPDTANHNILMDLKDEIPYFLYYLSTLDAIDIRKTRMVFTPDELETDALSIVKEESKPELQKEIEYLFDEWFSNNQNVQEALFTGNDIKDFWFKHDTKYSRAYIIKVLKTFMKLEPSDLTRYTPFYEALISKTGRVYKLTNPYFKGEVVEQTSLDVDDNDDMPF